jgi:hypothetical protein
VALAGVAGNEAGTPQGEFLLDIYGGAQSATDGQVLTADGAGGADWEDAPETGIPLIDPAVAGNLVTQAADGTLVDAGYAADVNATAGSVVRRGTSGEIDNSILSGNSSAIYGYSSGNGVGVESYSNLGPGALSRTFSGAYHHVFGDKDGPVSAIDRVTGALVFLGASADTNRAAQRLEIGALPLDANVTTARTSGYTFQSSDRGAVIPVSGTFTFSLPNGMPTGAQALLVRTGAGTVTLAAATTLVSDGTQLSEDGAAATVLHLGSNVWYAFGKLS